MGSHQNTDTTRSGGRGEIFFLAYKKLGNFFFFFDYWESVRAVMGSLCAEK